MNRNKKYKVFFGIIIALIIGMMGFAFFHNSGTGDSTKYTREASRKTITLSNTEFIRNLKHGNSYVDKFFGGHWSPMIMPINEKYQGLLKEKVVFLRDEQEITNWTELVVLDTYTDAAFPNVSTYLKKHARELQKKNPDGKVKIMHDGEKGIMYQWVIPDENGKTKYLEFGWVEMTDEGLLSVKYVNKGTENLELQRQRAIKFFTKFVQ